LGKSRQPAASGKTVHEPVERDQLEETLSLEGLAPGHSGAHGLHPAPIPASWVLEGAPLARERSLASSSDGTACAVMWDCTSGRFQWEYRGEEIVHVLQGCALIDIAGMSRRLQSGDTHVFHTGSRYRWTVPDYVRTVTFRLQVATSGPLGRRLQSALGGSWRAKRARSS
jgi:uncharacterized cupin superfamily protein